MTLSTFPETPTSFARNAGETEAAYLSRVRYQLKVEWPRGIVDPALPTTQQYVHGDATDCLARFFGYTAAGTVSVDELEAALVAQCG
jgi:hypothetical protein